MSKKTILGCSFAALLLGVLWWAHESWQTPRLSIEKTEATVRLNDRIDNLEKVLSQHAKVIDNHAKVIIALRNGFQEAQKATREAKAPPPNDPVSGNGDHF